MDRREGRSKQGLRPSQGSIQSVVTMAKKLKLFVKKEKKYAYREIRTSERLHYKSPYQTTEPPEVSTGQCYKQAFIVILYTRARSYKNAVIIAVELFLRYRKNSHYDY